MKETGTVCKSLTWGCSNKTKENVYPFLYQFCKQYRKQHNNNRFVSIKLTAKDGEQKAKKATHISDPKLYFEIKDADLIAKEFSYPYWTMLYEVHQMCEICKRTEKRTMKSKEDLLGNWKIC